MASSELVKSANEKQEEENVRRRLQIELSPQAYERLGELRNKAEAASNTELVRNALRLYEWFLEVRRNNFKIQVVKDNVTKDVEIIF